MTDRHRLPDPLGAARALPRGSAVILRDAPDRLALGRALKALCARRGLLLLVAGDPALARALKADGVHWPEARLPRRVGAPWALVTASAHGRAGLVRARAAGVDAVLVSPVLPTDSHPGAKALGLVRFRALARAADPPVLALGGIDAKTARRLFARGLGRGAPAGVAAIGALARGST